MFQGQGRGLLVHVSLNRPESGQPRRIVQAEIVKSNPKTVHVRLPDGTVVKRKRRRDL